MPRLTRNLLLAAAVFAGTLVTAFQADAFEPLCIRQTSDQYRQSVRQFEREVSRSRFASHNNRHDVRRLRQTADRFHSAVRHNSDYFRFASSWQDLSDMHYRVERSFIAGCQQSDPRLFHAWPHVTLRFDRLSNAVHYQANIGRGRPSVWDPRGVWGQEGGGNRYGHDHFDRDHFDRERYSAPLHGHDSFGHDSFGHTPFGSRHSVGRPPLGASVQPIHPVPPVRGFSPHVDPRREAGAAITAAILQRLFN